jgi:predicted metal-dependent hydrolase
MLTDPELGTIEFTRNERSKHIRVRILSNGLRVTLPYRASEQDAIAFINSIRSKIIQKQQKLEKGLELLEGLDGCEAFTLLQLDADNTGATVE